jgi:2-polyprenyl-3-methyl-5-hydroxy-6-metoxy-1,4-benzoquinol methylase/ribosomal protein S27E
VQSTNHTKDSPAHDGSSLGERLSEKELCPDDLLSGQEAAFARDIARLQARRDEFVKVGCPACRSSHATDVFTKFGFAFRSCEECATIFMSPRPSPAVMGDYYSNSENYEYWAKHIFPASEASRREKIHKPWLSRIVDICERHHVDRGVLLEVGPGFGTFASVATESGAFRRVVTVEPTPEMADACRARGVEVIQSRIEDVREELTAVDIAVAFEVIEHLFDPSVFLGQCARLIKPGGLLVLSCPNGLGFDIAMLREKALAVDAEHVNLFNPASLGRLLKDCGFEVLEATTPGRLDAEFVREAVLKGEFDLQGDAFLKRVLIDEWDQLGWPFQQFLSSQGLSSHMWIAARRVAGAGHE